MCLGYCVQKRKEDRFEDRGSKDLEYAEKELIDNLLNRSETITWITVSKVKLLRLLKRLVSIADDNLFAGEVGREERRVQGETHLASYNDHRNSSNRLVLF